MKHGIKSQWADDDGQLDQIMQQLRDDDELGEHEGYRWVHSVVNEAVPGDERVGEKRVRAAVKRVPDHRLPTTDWQSGNRQSGNRSCQASPGGQSGYRMLFSVIGSRASSREPDYRLPIG